MFCLNNRAETAYDVPNVTKLEGHMAEQELAAVVRSAIRRSDTLQMGAIPLLYPVLDVLGLRETVNALCPYCSRS